MSEEHEIEQSVTREEAVATMQAVVDGVASGTLRFDAADVETIDVEVPDVVELEVELELEEDEDDVELEIELEWPVEEQAEASPKGQEAEASPDDQELEQSEDHATEADEDDATEASGEHASEASEERAAKTTQDRETETPAEQAGDLDANGPHAIDAAVLGPAEPRESLARFEVYQDRAEEWRWRLVHHNGNVIADGGEGYTSKQSALKGLRSVMANAPNATVEDQSEE